MALCPAGHDSATSDYCDDCGTSMAAPATPDAPAASCANCGAPRDARFCEACGHDSTRPVPTPPTPTPPVVAPEAASGEWSVVVTADRSWFDEVRRRANRDAATLEFPLCCPPRRFVLSGSQLAIGRRSRSRGTDPEIDLTGPPLDPGVSALHAVLLPRPDGGWSLVDLGSTNGTAVGDDPEPIPPNRSVPLTAGDRIRIGAWTALTVTFAPG